MEITSSLSSSRNPFFQYSYSLFQKGKSKTYLEIDSICCSVAKLCWTLCNPMDCTVTGFPVLHYLPEFTQTFVH